MLSLIRKLNGTAPAPIGIDCGCRLLKAVQLRPEGGTLGVVASAAAPVPDRVWDDAAALAQFFRRDVRALLASNGFRGRHVALALPAHHMHAASVRKEHQPETIPDETWEDASPQWLPFHASEAVVRDVDAGEVYDGGARRREVVTIAVRRPVVDAYVAAAAEARLQVVGVAAEPEALLAALATGPDSRTMRLVVDLGFSSTRVYAGIGRRLMFARRLGTGGRHLERAVTSAVGVGPEEACSLRRRLPPLGRDGTLPDERLRKVDEACQETVFRLVTEIKLCLSYLAGVFAETPVHHIVFVGGGAKYWRLCQRVASGVGLPARTADPMARLAQDPQPVRGRHDQSSSGPIWATAVGLAMQGARSGTAAAGGGAAAWRDEDAALRRVSLAT